MSDATTTEAPKVEEVTGQKNAAEPKAPRKRASNKPTALEAIVKVMFENGPTKTMKVPEIIKAAVPLTALKGAHPGQTIYSVIYSNAKKAGALVEQVGKGEFKLTAAGKKAATGTTPAATQEAKSDPKPASTRKRATRKAAAAA